MKTRCITFNPWLYNSLGHSLIYTQAIEKAALLNNWEFIAFLPEKNTLESLPCNWQKRMRCPTVRHWFEAIENRPYRRPKKIIRAKERAQYYFSIYLAFSKYLSNKNENTILFLEAFAQTDVKLLVNLLRVFPKKNLSVGLIHRYQSSTLKSDVQRYQKYHQKFLEMGVNLKLFTDSDLLKEDLEPKFNLPITVLPVHYIEPIEEVNKSHSEIICWWPGVIREGKGLHIIRDYARSSSPENSRIHLVVNENSALSCHEKSPKVTLLENHLPREGYLSWMQKSDVILLPYLDPHYEKATSSIFLEAVLAGKVPLVYPGTWMAYELQKHQIPELIIDWSPKILSRKIIEMTSNPSILERLKDLKTHYEHFHTLENYAKVLDQAVFNFS